MSRRFKSLKLVALAAFLLAEAAQAADQEITLVIKDHRFEPSEVRVPANRKVKLLVQNQDASAEEFDSHALNREKVIPANGKATIYIGPLAAGRYPFMGEFHAKTAQGVVIAE